MATFAVFIEGVLRSDTGTTIYQGLGLYRMLAEGNKVFLLSANKDKDERWLKENKIWQVDDVIGENVPGAKEELNFRQVEHCRAKGAGLEMVVTSDPELAKKLLNIGVTTLMLLQPYYIKEEFRPDSRQGIKSWSSIVDELVKQQEKFVQDPRRSE